MKVSEPIGEVVGFSRRRVRQAARSARSARRAARPTKPPAAPQDVWHWTSGKYRARSVILLLVNAVLFAGLGCFTFWLRTGEYTPFSANRYSEYFWQAFNPSHERPATLIDYLVATIPVDQVPLMLVIVGLVLASLTAIPILVSMLYRFPFSLIFTFIIAFVAVMPSLAVFVTICCYLARWRPLRFSFRYATALISLLPLIAYYVIGTRNAPPLAELPLMETARFYVSWALALIGACVVMGVVLLIARWVNYRPGAIAPLLAVMFAVPVALFEAKVGRHELYYRLLETRYGPGSNTHFVNNVDAQSIVDQIAEEQRRVLGPDRATLEALREQARLKLSMTLFETFAGEQAQAVSACRAFREDYPDSRYVSNALYLEGRAWDMRVDREFFRAHLLVRYYEDFPHRSSRQVWQALYDRFGDAEPASPLVAEGTYRLALVTARDGEGGDPVGDAIGLLEGLIERFGKRAEAEPSPSEPEGLSGILAKRDPSDRLGVKSTPAVAKARKLLDLFVHNRDPQQRDLPLRELLKCDPHHPSYRAQLEKMLADLPKRYPLTKLGDNLRLRRALASKGPVSRLAKINRLREVVEDLADEPDSDALPRARFELGAAYEEDNLPRLALQVYREVVDHHPDAPWAADAQSRLAALSVGAGTETQE